MKKQLSPQVAAVASLIYEKEITTFEDTGCVEESWKKAGHDKMIPESKFCVIAGARFPDKETIETAYSYGTAVKYNYASYNYVTYAK